MTRIKKAAGGRSRLWLGLPLLAVVLGTLVLVQGAFSQPSASRKPTHAAKPARSARLAALNCGDSVPTSTTLTANLSGCSGNGLVITGNGVTLNLNGHTISGSATAGEAAGVLNSSHTSVVIKNGTIWGFGSGVEFDGGTGTVQGLRVHDNGSGIVLDGLAETVTGNTVAGNTFYGIATCCSGKPTITNNVSNSNGQDGIHVAASAAGALVSGNRTLSNGNSGIYVSAPGAIVSGNTANANGFGMHVFSPDPLVPLKASKNKAYFNTLLGIEINPGDIDLGGNTAGGNGSAHQCEDIVCS